LNQRAQAGVAVLDEKIYSLGSIVSGHTLKHLAAAAASLAILRLLQTRRCAGADHLSAQSLRMTMIGIMLYKDWPQ
jgi:hypothetical protein